MKVVDETQNIRDIEEKIAGGLVEELIFQAHNEIKLLRIMKNWKPWEYLHTRDFEDKEILNDFMSFKNGNPFPSH
jgi:NADH dehydrogenase (ubiquinone) 1 alpha subcomplex subunit 5